jgi:signal transduction histidine kinase
MAAPAVAPGRFRRRLTIAFVLVAGVSAAVLAAGSYLMVRQARLDDSLTQAAADTRYQIVLAQQFVPLDEQRRASLLTSFEDSGRHVLLVADRQPADPDAAAGGVLASNASFAPTPGRQLRAAVAAGQLAFERGHTGGSPHLLTVGGRIPGSTAELYVVRDESRIYHDLGQLRTALIAGWIAVIILAGAVGNILARRTLEPVARASQAARAVAEGLLATRLPVSGRDEFGVWAASFNDMAEALEGKISALSAAQARERRFTADVAHELRTPVTALVAAASLLRAHLDRLPAETRRPAELLVADVVRLRRLVDELMEISRLDAGQEAISVDRVDPVELLNSIVDANGWRDRVAVTGTSAAVLTDPRRLDRILSNLVANAIQHGGQGVRAEVGADGGLTTIRVTDDGPGIRADQLPHVFDRFYMGDPSRSGRGSGLGLAIAWENARLIDARLAVRSTVGVGTEFRLEMPTTLRVPDDGSRGVS